LPYYRKTMDFTPPNDATRFANASPTYDIFGVAEGGPVDITYPAYAESWSTWVGRGLAAIGVARTGALIDGSLFGSTWQLYTVNHATGDRVSSETAYLHPAQGRHNLVVMTETLAERVLFNANKDATGVVVSTSKGMSTITARKEVIISASTFQSPQLLMVSGIGPQAVLEQLNITVIANRPGVGQGMRDHILIPLTYQVNIESVNPNSASSVYEFQRQARGPLTNPGGDFVGLEKIPTALRANWSSETTTGKQPLHQSSCP
jgi:choline dehydrogenase